ncbi:MAG: hypothetical protein QW186_08770 [Candidatus Bathyarchaeia archaeon]
MGFTFGKATLTLGDVVRDVGMRGKSSTAGSETVVHTTDFSTANIARVGINLTARNSNSGYKAFAKVRRDSIDGEILLEGFMYDTVETKIASGVFDKGSGVFVWTLWRDNYTAYLGSRSGAVGGSIVLGINASPTVMPIKLSLTSLRAASLISPAAINGFGCLNPITYSMPAANTFFSNLTITVATVYAGEEFVALSMEGWILTLS